VTEPSRAIRQSAVIPYRWRQGRLEFLVIRSSDDSRWVVPKGRIEPGLTPAASAAKEAFEEAGVTGQVSTSAVGTYTYEKWNSAYTVEVFLLRVDEVLDDWAECYRVREWVPVAEAADRVGEPRLKELLTLVPVLARP
jgi:phosphohistidine phosphatase